MDKKFYEMPEMEVIKLEAEGYLVDTSLGGGIGEGGEAGEGGEGGEGDFDW